MAQAALGPRFRWLRPDFQNKTATSTQTTIPLTSQDPTSRIPQPASRIAWPKSLPDQMRQLRQALIESPVPVTAQEMAGRFTRARVDKVEELLQTLVTLGQARELPGGKYGT